MTTGPGEDDAAGGFSVEGNGVGGWTVYCRRCKQNLGTTTMSGTSRLASIHACPLVHSGRTMREPFGGPLPMKPGQEQARMSLTTEAKAKAVELARLLGARSWMTIVFLVLHGSLEEAAGRLDERGVTMLHALQRELLGPAPEQLD